MTLSQSRREMGFPWEARCDDQAWSNRFTKALEQYRQIGPLSGSKIQAIAAGLDDWAEMLPQRGSGEHGRPIPANEWGIGPEAAVCQSLLTFLTLSGNDTLADRLEGLLLQLKKTAGNLDEAVMSSVPMETAIRRLTSISREQAHLLADLLRMVAKTHWPNSNEGDFGNLPSDQGSGSCANGVLFTDTEQNILQALGSDTLTGSELAKRAGYPLNSNFKATLSSLRKRGVLGNASPGYYIDEAYQYLLYRSQDRGQA